MTDVTLRPMARALLHEYYRGFRMDSAIFADMSRYREYVYSPEAVDAYFDRLAAAEDRVDFLVMLGERPIGEVALKRVDRAAGTCELAIHLQNDTVKNRGYGTRAEQLAVACAFAEMGMKAVLADAVAKNLRSRRVLEKVGFRQVGEDGIFVCYRLERADWERKIPIGGEA